MLLGHFAWHSLANALEIITFGGHKALIGWLTTEKFSHNIDPADDALAYPMQRACLCAISAICRHGEDTTGAMLELATSEVIFRFVGHLDVALRRAAVRCLARLIPFAAKRAPTLTPLNAELGWQTIFQEIVSPDEVMRTVSSCCILEAIQDGWVSRGDCLEPEELGVHMYNALKKASSRNAAPAALPLFLSISLLSASVNEKEAIIAASVHNQEGIVPLLVSWLPKGANSRCSAAARGSATAAAHTLRTLAEHGHPLGAAELGTLLRYGTSMVAESMLREACNAAFCCVVSREQDISLLLQLAVARLETAGFNYEDPICDLETISVIVLRIVQVLKQSTHQATEHLSSHIDRAISLVPADAKDAGGLLQLLREADHLAAALRADTTITVKTMRR